jgi:hypothetical protein
MSLFRACVCLCKTSFYTVFILHGFALSATFQIANGQVERARKSSCAKAFHFRQRDAAKDSLLHNAWVQQRQELGVGHASAVGKDLYSADSGTRFELIGNQITPPTQIGIGGEGEPVFGPGTAQEAAYAVSQVWQVAPVEPGT